MLWGYLVRSSIGSHMIIPRSLIYTNRPSYICQKYIRVFDNTEQQQATKIFSQLEENILWSSVLNCWSIEAVRKLIAAENISRSQEKVY